MRFERKGREFESLQGRQRNVELIPKAVLLELPQRSITHVSWVDALGDRQSKPIEAKQREESGVLSVCSYSFNEALSKMDISSPVATHVSSEYRFRVDIRIQNRPEFDGVYFVSGWRDFGTCSLDLDPVQHRELGRRAAIQAKKDRIEANLKRK